jgi:hypothetical protein
MILHETFTDKIFIAFYPFIAYPTTRLSQAKLTLVKQE